jgi:hypothetical protein
VTSDRSKAFAQLAMSYYQVLAPRFEYYEKAARLERPSTLFGFGLAVAVAEFFVSAGPANAQKDRELGRRKRAAARRTKQARIAARQWASRPTMRDAVRDEYDQAFAEWFMLQRRQDELRPELTRRRRPKLTAARALVCSVALVYSRSTGRAPTIVTNLGHEHEHTGPFADLLRALDEDIRILINRLKPALLKSWPTSLPRFAKTVRSEIIALPNGNRRDC